MDFVRLQKEKITIHKGCTIGRFFFFFLFVFFFPVLGSAALKIPQKSRGRRLCISFSRKDLRQVEVLDFTQ